jgi:YD repeat-containing protein
VTSTHDDAGRVTKREYPNDATVTLEYDDAGRLTEVEDGNGTWEYTYDEVGRLESVTDPMNKRGKRGHSTPVRPGVCSGLIVAPSLRELKGAMDDGLN